MRVAHRDDHDTHAVIGGNNVQEFEIAQTAEFFTVLSNTLRATASALSGKSVGVLTHLLYR